MWVPGRPQLMASHDEGRQRLLAARFATANFSTEQAFSARVFRVGDLGERIARDFTWSKVRVSESSCCWSIFAVMVDWNEIRKKFPVTERVAYLNSAAAGPLSVASQAAAAGYYEKMMRDGDVHWNRWLADREGVRQKVADYINAEPEEIAFTTNTSQGMNVIVDALEDRGEVISSELEFPVTTLPWMHRRIPVHLLKAVAGEVRVEDVGDAMSDKTAVIALSHVQFSNGCRIDPTAFGEIKGRHALVINASQSAGAFAIDVKEMKIDALCATGHKWLLSGYGSGFV